MRKYHSPCDTSCNRIGTEYYCRVKYMYTFLIRCDVGQAVYMLCRVCKQMTNSAYGSCKENLGTCRSFYYPHSIRAMQDRLELI